jgi:hypothetical protein
MAATVAAWKSASVATATRSANVDALNSWSACSEHRHHRHLGEAPGRDRLRKAA